MAKYDTINTRFVRDKFTGKTIIVHLYMGVNGGRVKHKVFEETYDYRSGIWKEISTLR